MDKLYPSLNTLLSKKYEFIEYLLTTNSKFDIKLLERLKSSSYIDYSKIHPDINIDICVLDTLYRNSQKSYLCGKYYLCNYKLSPDEPISMKRLLEEQKRINEGEYYRDVCNSAEYASVQFMISTFTKFMKLLEIYDNMGLFNVKQRLAFFKILHPRLGDKADQTIHFDIVHKVLEENINKKIRKKE